MYFKLSEEWFVSPQTIISGVSVVEARTEEIQLIDESRYVSNDTGVVQKLEAGIACLL